MSYAMKEIYSSTNDGKLTSLYRGQNYEVNITVKTSPNSEDIEKPEYSIRVNKRDKIAEKAGDQMIEEVMDSVKKMQDRDRK